MASISITSDLRPDQAVPIPSQPSPSPSQSSRNDQDHDPAPSVSQSQTSFPTDNNSSELGSSSLLSQLTTTANDPNISPTCATDTTRVIDPPTIPQPSVDCSSRTTSTAQLTSLNSTTSTAASSLSGRRGSLAMLKIPAGLGDSSKGRNRGSSPTTPVSEVPENQASMGKSMNARPGSSRSAAAGKGKEEFEMTAVSTARPATRRQDDAAPTLLAADRNKEEQAMAKWRKWIVEQPEQAVTTDNSPIRSRRASPANSLGISNGAGASPRVGLFSSPMTGSSVSPRQAFGPVSSLTGVEPHRSTSAESSTSAHARGFSPLGDSSRFGSSEFEVFNTESVLALRDVELAVDEEVLERAERAKNSAARRMSSQPRVSDLPNPFVDIAHRLGSRRVRPIVLELIQALGHFVDAVWCHNYPDRLCPWIIGIDESPAPASIRRMTGQSTLDDAEGKTLWKSPMITAVQEGKRTGHVGSPPTTKDIRFWGDEVTFSIRDVDEVVGIYKGVGWAFGSAMRDGEYGHVVQENVLGVKGEGGGMVRLLNDLEEAIWGDAPPRPTDLAYDLPIDFDPYAIPDDVELLAAVSMPRGGGAGGRGLSDFFASTAVGPAGPLASPPLPVTEEEIYALPDLVQATADDNDNTSDLEGETDAVQVVSPALAQSPTVPVISGAGHRPRGVIPGIDIEGSEELSLEELGKKRHREWLESRGAGMDVW